MTWCGIGGGTLFFPVTPFSASDGRVDDGLLREFTAARLASGHRVSAVFAACGTGEFYALAASEVGAVVASCVAESGELPVIGGAGGPLGHAIDCGRHAAAAGASALLVFPPYLVGATTSGLVRYVEAIAEAAALPLIVYSRPPLPLDVGAATTLAGDSRVVGIKDGAGDIDVLLAARASAAAGNRREFEVFNGLPFAELHDAEYRHQGVTAYSSSTFVMAPAIAAAYRTAAEHGDAGRVAALLERFYLPLERLRAVGEGYNVSLVKAAVVAEGFAVGSVRAPLLPPDERHVTALLELLAVGRELADR